MFMKKGLLVLALCALTTSVSAAATDNPFARDEAVLRLNGLDLSTAEGQQRLAIRMDNAARAVCGDRMFNVHLAADARARECRTAVLADIRAEIEARTALATETGQTQLASR
jgi:UrcA family protein